MKFNKRTLFEIVLLVIIFIQAYCIYWLYNIADKQLFSEMHGTSMDFYCSDKIKTLLQLKDNGDHDALINYGNELVSNGWDDDKFVLQLMARAYYAKENIRKAVLLMNRAIKANYKCKIAEPTNEEFKNYENAVIIYNLSQLYKELGDVIRADEEYKNAVELAKKVWGKKYKEQDFLKLCKSLSFKKKSQ